MINFAEYLTGLKVRGDIRFSKGKFYGNEGGQMGLLDLGDLKDKSIEDLKIPIRGYRRNGIPVVKDHTYLSLCNRGEKTNRVIFRVGSIEKNSVSIEVLSQANV